MALGLYSSKLSFAYLAGAEMMALAPFSRIKLAIEACSAALANGMDKEALWSNLNADGFLLDRLAAGDKRDGALLADKLEDANLGFLQGPCPASSKPSETTTNLPLTLPQKSASLRTRANSRSFSLSCRFLVCT